MSVFDVGKIARLKRGLVIGLDQGDMVTIAESNSDSKKTYVHFGFHLNKSDLVLVDDSKPDYETSNRKKLHDHIKESGYTSSELGEVMGSKWYFSNITKPSRMSRGDISDADLLHLIWVVDSCGCMVDASKIVASRTKKESNDLSGNVETEIDSEFQFVGSVYDKIIPIKKVEDNYLFDTDTRKSSGTGASQSNWMNLNKIAFVMCFIVVILLISILYFVVSK